MSSKKEEGVSAESSEVSRFYQGKSLFITGAAGFLGSVMLETLLRCCPGIQRIYILLRPKKGVQPEDRKAVIFKKEIFYKIKEEDPDVFKKVIAIPGDVTQNNLGMCEDDLIKIAEEVSVVFHCAASINFLKSLSYMLQQNVMGTQNMIEFCRKLRNFEVLVYTSTAYSNCNRENIDEIIYKMPFTAGEALEVAKNGNEEDLTCLFKKCNPQFPNNYAFSKCVAENLISERARDLRICIVRPSIVQCCWKGVLPGFTEYGSGLMDMIIGIGKGIISVIPIDVDKITDQVPADIVANTHIVAAFNQVSKRLSSPFVYNCTSGEIAAFTLSQLLVALEKMCLEYPMPNSFQKPVIISCKNPVKYWVFSVFDHFLPAIVIDFFLWISGSKLRLFKIYVAYEKKRKCLEYFVCREWIFRCENFKSLSEKLNSTDAEMFPVDLKGFGPEEIMKCLVAGAPMYRRKNDSETNKKRLRILLYLRYCLTSFIKWSTLGGIVSIFYMTLLKSDEDC